MKFIRRTSIAIALVGLLAAFSAVGNEAFARERGRRHHSPPPEAYAACEGKSAGDTVTGTCEQDGDRLVLRPDHPPRDRGSDSTDD